MRTAAVWALGAALSTETVRAAGPGPDVAIEWLRYGNERHAEGKYVHWHQSLDRRKEVAHAQRPHAIVLSCSDSQAPPEILFDQGLGDLYVVRVAGGVAGEKELASIEYAAAELGVSLIVVLGHQRCGIVHMAVQGGGQAAGHLASIVASLSPAVARAKRLPGDAADQTIRANAEITADRLRDSEPVLAPLVRAGKLKVTSAYYNLDSGAVSWTEMGRAEALPQVSTTRH